MVKILRNALIIRKLWLKQSIKYAPLSMIETLYEQASQQTAEAAAALLPDAQEQALDEYPMPDPVLTQDDLEKCGCLDSDLLPLSKERAYELMERDLTVYIIQEGENPAMAFDTADLDAHDGIFAVSREEWEESPEFDKLVKDRMDHQEEREQAFLSHKGGLLRHLSGEAHRRAAGHPLRGPGMDQVHRADGAAGQL